MSFNKLDHSSKKLKKITSVLIKVVECPICLDTVKVPFKQCATGHVLCSDCIKTLVRCPTCQQPFTAENPVIMKSLLEALPRLCRYSDAGCEQVVEPGEEHEAFCGYRPVSCRYSGCTDTKVLCQLLKHFETDHTAASVIKKEEQPLSWSKFNSETPQKASNLVLLFNKLFYVNVENDSIKKFLRFSFQSIPDREETGDYYLRVKLKNDNYVYSHTVKASVLSIDNEEEEAHGEDQQLMHYMKVPQSELHHFINEQGKLEYKLFFFEAAK